MVQRSVAARARGFTLLEVLLAMAITAMVAVMGYAGLTAAMNAAERHGRQVQRLGEIQAALGYLVRDLRQSVDRPIVDARGDQEPAIIGNAEEEQFLSLTRVGWDNPRGQRRGSVQRVRYRLDANGDLWREHWLVLDRVDDEDHLQSVKLLSGVDHIRLQFIQADPPEKKDSGDGGQPGAGGLSGMGDQKSGGGSGRKSGKKDDTGLGGEWVEQWPPADSDSNSDPNDVPMPLAVRVELEIRDIGVINRVVGLVNAQPE